MEAVLRFEHGIELRFDDSQWHAPAAARTRMRSEAVAAPSAVTPAIAPSQWIAQRVLAQGLARSATHVALQRTTGARAHALDRAAAPVLKVPLSADEHAVLLVESERVVAWQFAERVEEPALATRASHAPSTREAVFVLAEPGRAALAHAVPRELAPFAGWLVGAIEATVIKFIARRAAGSLVAALESGKREGPVVLGDASDPARWEEPDAFPFVVAPRARPARILLFVHGTFSSVKAGFGSLCATDAGRSFLAGASRQYGAVWGWDHRTLSADPATNARRLFDALAALTLARPPVVDIVCHSRGALVVRQLVEEVLPAKAWRPEIGRVVFIAGANAGTPLARPANWRALVDLLTNLALAGQSALAALGAPQVAAAAAPLVDAIAEFVAALAEAGLDARIAPGLAALDPDGPFVKALNRVDSGEPAPASCDYRVVESDFHAEIVDEATHRPAEFPRRLALLLANGFADALMQDAPNDLVVDVPSMSAINRPAREVKEALDFGRNALVYHTNYLLQPETIAALARWLAIGAPAATAGTQKSRGTQAHPA